MKGEGRSSCSFLSSPHENRSFEIPSAASSNKEGSLPRVAVEIHGHGDVRNVGRVTSELRFAVKPKVVLRRATFITDVSLARASAQPRATGSKVRTPRGSVARRAASCVTRARALAYTRLSVNFVRLAGPRGDDSSDRRDVIGADPLGVVCVCVYFASTIGAVNGPRFGRRGCSSDGGSASRHARAVRTRVFARCFREESAVRCDHGNEDDAAEEDAHLRRRTRTRVAGDLARARAQRRALSPLSFSRVPANIVQRQIRARCHNRGADAIECAGARKYALAFRPTEGTRVGRGDPIATGEFRRSYIPAFGDRSLLSSSSSLLPSSLSSSSSSSSPSSYY